MKIGIIGCRGIPNNYGGFEQFAQYLAKGLAERGHDIYVYNSHNHPYQQQTWNGVNIIHCTDPEDIIGITGQFLYDFNCIIDCRRQNFDIILQLGYTSNSVWGWLLPKQSVITTNMDGLEWKRNKYTQSTRAFLKKAESLAVKYSDYLIADSPGIQSYLKKTYGVSSVYIPYGAHAFESADESYLKKFKLSSFSYNMLIARLEPENSIGIILEAVAKTNSERPFLVIGNHNLKYGEYLKKKYYNNPSIKFMGSIYDITLLNNLRYFSNLYFHGHTVGGTNPSLLEAMASQAFICAHENAFNASTLGDNALYFKNVGDVCDILNTPAREKHPHFVSNNLHKIKTTYDWSLIIDQYEEHFFQICPPHKGLKVLSTMQKVI